MIEINGAVQDHPRITYLCILTFFTMNFVGACFSNKSSIAITIVANRFEDQL